MFDLDCVGTVGTRFFAVHAWYVERKLEEEAGTREQEGSAQIDL
jgi:hypothetical protein